MSEFDDIDVYKVLSRQDTSFYSDHPKPHFPKPDDSEYASGYVRRYFSRKTNDENAPIVEISEHTASLFVDNPFYIIVGITWKIAGQMNTVNLGGVEYEEGVAEYNHRAVTNANTKIPGLQDKLSDVFQFYRSQKRS
tara:strand:+ start:65476 stop:65886 length:411 start_codon:yes stop_codon:yes gene_type:complete